MSRSVELQTKAQALADLFIEVKALAEENNYGMEFDTYDGTIDFNDWLSSSCYGEGDEAFGVGPKGQVWHSSSC
ncbi:hypothetical protein NCTGTJJY_CDS0131 [Serratia phage 92A1]|nr:hypothetical protein NCTGTJJY_CDS0131 [Serratia phage 92A1]